MLSLKLSSSPKQTAISLLAPLKEGFGFFFPYAPNKSLHFLKFPINKHTARYRNHTRVNKAGEERVLSATTNSQLQTAARAEPCYFKGSRQARSELWG